jgi:hypothetical protein
MCRPPVTNVTTLAGASGVAPRVDVVRWGTPGLYTSGSCPAGSFSTFFGAPRLVYFLNLGPGVPLGGTLTLTTCGHTADNTVLYVGLGCPTWTLSFQCVRANDDAGDGGQGGACPGNPGASTVTLVAASRFYFLQLGAVPGSPAISGLAWNYSLPAASAGGTPTATRTGSASRSRSRSRSRTRSRSRPATPSRAASPTASRSRTRKAKR